MADDENKNPQPHCEELEAMYENDWSQMRSHGLGDLGEPAATGSRQPPQQLENKIN